MYTEVRKVPCLITTNNRFSLWLVGVFGLQAVGSNLDPDIKRLFPLSGLGPSIGNNVFDMKAWRLEAA